MNKKNKFYVNRKYTPLKLFITYIIITLLASIFGPWSYLQYDKLYVSLFILIFIIIIMISYLYFINYNKGIKILLYNKEIKVLKISNFKITEICINLSIFLYILMIGIKISEVGIPNARNIFKVMAQAYTDKVYISSVFNMSGWLFGYFSIVYVISVILGAYYFRNLKRKYKILYLLNLILAIVYNILFVGNQKALGDIIIYLASVFFIKFCRTGRRINIKVLVISIFLILGSILLFSNVLVNRMDLWGVMYYSVGDRAFLDINHWSLSIFSDRLKVGVGTFIYYISHGYYGLSLCLNLPFVWSFGYGSSFAIKDILNKFIYMSDDMIASYPIRMEQVTGWKAYANWHTIFPWLASDFTFIGAILFIAIVIAIYAISWNKILNRGHYSNILMFSHLNILLLYVPANNQLFQTRASLIVTVLIFILWIFNYSKGENNHD